jgi:hypothetical protein
MGGALMAYGRLATRNTSGLHPNLRGLGAYAELSTHNSNGLSPNFRGMGDVPLTSFVIGPGGQFSVSSVTTPTGTSIWDQILTWLSSSTFVPGMPNSVFAIGGGLLLLSTFHHRGKR